MRKFVWCGVVFSVFLFLSPRPVSAWGHTWAGALLESAFNALTWRLGPFRYNAALMLDNTGYDSDIYSGMRARKTPDFVLSLAPDFQTMIPFSKKFVLEVDDSPQYSFFLDTRSERNWNNEFISRAHVVLDKWYFQVGGVFNNVRERLSPEIEIRARRKEENLTGLALWQISKARSLLFQYSTLRLRYNDLEDGVDEFNRNLDRRESYFSVGALSQNRARAMYFLNAEYGTIDFSQMESRFKNTASYAVYGGVEFLPSPEGSSSLARFTGRLDIGYNWFNLLALGAKDYHGLVANTNMTFGLNRSTSLQLRLSRGPRFSAYSNIDFYVQTAAGVGISHSFTRRLTLSYDITYGRNIYRAAGEAVGVPGERITKDLYQAIRLKMKLRRDLTVTLIGDLVNRNSWLTEQPDSSRVLLGIGLIYGFPGIESTVPTILNSR